MSELASPSPETNTNTHRRLIKLWRSLALLAMVELGLWQWIAYPLPVAALIMALPLLAFIPLWWQASKYPLLVGRLSILWLAVLLSYSLMEVLAHPIVRALAVTQGVLDVLIYFAALGVIRSSHSTLSNEEPIMTIERSA